MKINDLIVALLKESKSRNVRYCVFESTDSWDIFLEDNTHIEVEKKSVDPKALKIIEELYVNQCTRLGRLLKGLS